MVSESYKFINLNRVFKLKSSFHCESMNLIYAVICIDCFEEYVRETSGQLKNRLRIYIRDIRQPEYQQLEAEEHFRICGKGKFKIFPFFKVKENNKSFGKSCEIIEKFQPFLTL